MGERTMKQALVVYTMRFAKGGVSQLITCHAARDKALEILREKTGMGWVLVFFDYAPQE